MLIQKKEIGHAYHCQDRSASVVREGSRGGRTFLHVDFSNSRIERITEVPTDTPSGPAGSVKVVEFIIAGQPFMAITAGPLDPFNHAISFYVMCEDQAEIDKYWAAFLAGGSEEQCGWLRDRYGVSWQIVPKVLGDMIADPDRERAKRVADAMLKMVKLDLPALQAAYKNTIV